MPSLPEVIRLSDSSTSDQYRAFGRGETVIVRDTENDPRTRPEFFRNINMRSFIAVPFQYFSEWKFLLIIADSRPREWREDEIKLFREIAIRVFPRLERARTEAVLRESEEKFRTLADASPTAILVYRGTRLLYVNPATVGFFGGTKEELLSTDLADIIHPDYREFVLGMVRARMAGERKEARYEMKAVTKSGGDKWLEVSSRLIQYEGSPAGLAIGMDITERKRAEDLLYASKKKIESILESITDLFIIYDYEWRFTDLNIRAEKSLGKSRAALIGKVLWDIFPELKETEIYARYLKAAETKSPEHFEA